MPIYEYECKSCKKVSELLQKLSDPAPTKCAHCGKNSLQKIMSRPAKHPGQIRNIPEADLPASAFRDLTPSHEGNIVKDSAGHYEQVDADDPRLKSDKAS